MGWEVLPFWLPEFLFLPPFVKDKKEKKNKAVSNIEISCSYIFTLEYVYIII